MANKKSTKRKQNHYGNPANYNKKTETPAGTPVAKQAESLKDWNLLCFFGMALGLMASKNYAIGALALIISIFVIVRFFFTMKRGTALAVCGVLFAVNGLYKYFKNGGGFSLMLNVTVGYVIAAIIVSLITIGILELYYLIKKQVKKSRN